MKKILFLYIVIGIWIGIYDYDVLLIYCTVVPIQFILLKMAQALNNFPYTMMEVIWFFSMGLGSVFFYLDRENAYPTGYGAVGNFDFSYNYFFTVYSFLLIFQIVIYLIVRSFGSRPSQFSIISFVRSEYDRLKFSRPISALPILICTLVFSGISIWMYTMKVGLIGVHQYKLPFHLTGVLFYVRRYFFPVILAYLYYRTKNKNTATILLIIYSIITGLAGSSKAGCLLVLFPIAFIAYMSDKKKLFWIVIVISVISYYYIGLTRTFIGELNGDIDFDDLIVKGALKTNSLFSAYDFMLDSIGAFSERLFGLRSAVLTYQYTKLSFDDLVNFYTLRQSMKQLIPNAAEDLFGVILPEDRAYGVSYGYTGSIIALANRNYYYIVIQAFIIGSILKIQGAFMNDIMNFDNRKAKYICIFAVCYGLLCLNDGYLLSHFYLVTVVLYFLKWICKHRYIIH